MSDIVTKIDSKTAQLERVTQGTSKIPFTIKQIKARLQKNADDRIYLQNLLDQATALGVAE